MTALGKVAECQACGAAIRFVRLSSGKLIPVNPTPGTDGNVCAYALSFGSYVRLEGWVVSREHPAVDGPLRFVPHYATCEESGRTAARDRPPPEPEPTLFDDQPTEETAP